MEPAVFQELHRILRAGGQLVSDVWLKGPVSGADVKELLHLTGFAVENLEDRTTTWLACLRWSIDQLGGHDLDRRASWQRSYEESVKRQDRSYQFVATRHDKPGPGRPPDT